MHKRYVLLARHGKTDGYGKVEGSDAVIVFLEKDRPLSNNGKIGGVWESTEVAVALRAECDSPSGGHQISIAEIWHSSHSCAKETAGIFGTALNRRKEACNELDPEMFRLKVDCKAFITTLRQRVNDLKDEEDLRRLKKDEVERVKDQEKGNAILLVGHEPQLGRVQQALCRRSIPIRNSAVVCIEVSGRKGQVLWAISPGGDEKTLRELKQKIRSKMATAKLLGTVISALLGVSLAALIEEGRFKRLETLKTVGVMKLSASFLFAALGLYLLAMFAYDRLLMPVPLWSHGKPSKQPDWLIARPPSSATHVIYLNMMHIWDWLFKPATWALVLGLLCLAWAAFAPEPIMSLPWADSEHSEFLCGLLEWLSAHSEPVVGAGFAAAVGFLYWKGRPVLGSRD